MTEDLNIDKNLEYLDNILGYLVHNTTDYSVNFGTLYNYKFQRDFDEDNKEFALGMHRTLDKDFSSFQFSLSDNNKAQAEKLYESLVFLYSKNLIRIDSKWNIKITFEGIIEYGKGGFVSKIKEERYKKFLDSFNVYITIAISLASLLIGIVIGGN